MRLSPQPPNSDFLIGWVCTLDKEYYAAMAVLEVEYRTIGNSGYTSSNSKYRLGRIAGHKVVINVPCGTNGLLTASQIAADMKNTFSCIRFVLLVGIGGGAPSQKTDVRLGDVVLGTSVIPYRKGKQRDDKFEIEHRIETPPRELLAAGIDLELNIRRGKSLEHLIEQVGQQSGGSTNIYRRPAEDHLVLSDFSHEDDTCDCLQSGSQGSYKLDKRPERASGSLVKMHKGIIGSADQVLRSAKERDRLSQEKNIICFEMEAAAVMKSMRCLTVRGISDYSDGHKNDEWHEYAALSAAVCARELLKLLSPDAVLHSKLELTPGQFIALVGERLVSAKKKMKRSAHQGDDETRESLQNAKNAKNELQESIDLVAKFKKQQGKAHKKISQDLRQLQEKLDASVDELRAYVSQRANTTAASDPSTQKEWKELQRQVDETKQRVNGLEIVRDVLATGAKRTLFIGGKIGSRTATDVGEWLREISDVIGDIAKIKMHISCWMRANSSPTPSPLATPPRDSQCSIDTPRTSADSRQDPQTEHLQTSLPGARSDSTSRPSSLGTSQSDPAPRRRPPPPIPAKRRGPPPPIPAKRRGPPPPIPAKPSRFS